MSLSFKYPDKLRLIKGEVKAMGEVDGYHLYIQARSELTRLFNESGLDAQACLNILEPEMAHGFNAIRVQAEDLRNKFNVCYKDDKKQTSLFSKEGNSIHNERPSQW